MVEQEWTVFRFGDDDNFPIPELETANFGDFWSRMGYSQ